MDFLNKVPKSVLVFVVFVLGIAGIFYFNKPHSICDSQAENLVELEKGFIYPKKVKGGGVAKGIFSKSVKECREGMGAPGACSEVIQILKKLDKDLESVDSSCGTTITEDSEDYSLIRKTMFTGILLLTQIAWGESVPASEGKPHRWLGPPEFALFCSLLSHWTRFYGEEGLIALKGAVYPKLPGGIYEVQPDGKRVCTDCVKLPDGKEDAPGAVESLMTSLASKGGKTLAQLSKEDKAKLMGETRKAVYNLSLLSINCAKYR